MTEEHLKQAKILYGTGSGFKEIEEYDLALNNFKESLTILQENDLIDNNVTDKVISAMNTIYLIKAKNAEDKLEYLTNTIDEMRSIYPSDHNMAIDGIIKITSEIGIYHRSLNNSNLAIQSTFESYKILKDYYKEKSSKHPFHEGLVKNLQTMAQDLNTKAMTLYNIDEYEQSIDLFKVLLEVIEFVSPESNMIIAQYAESIGTAYAKLNQCEKAIEPLEFSLASANPNVVATLNSCKNNDAMDLKELFSTQIIPQCKLLGEYTTIDDCYNQIMEA